MSEESVYIPDAVFPISKKRMLMQYLRWLPAKFGLINKTAFLFQIKKIKKDDIFLVSYPKSGNTWLRFIIAYLKNGTTKKITFHDLEQFVPDIYVSKDVIDQQKNNRIIKTHDIFFNGYPKVIYIHRDYRDALVSYYHFVNSLGYFKGSFQEFIRSKVIMRHGTWRQHIEAMLKFKKEHPNKILVLSYEQLLNNFEKSVRDIQQFCNFDQSISIQEIKSLTSFESLRQIENDFGSRFKNSTEKNFVREGKIGTWKDYFSEEDLSHIFQEKRVKELMIELEYI